MWGFRSVAEGTCISDGLGKDALVIEVHVLRPMAELSFDTEVWKRGRAF
jgi:hypothetical protein